MSTPWPTATTCFVAGIMEHIEEAGIHSGDSACSLPPLLARRPTVIAELERQTEALARGARRGRADERPVRDQGRRRSTCWRSTRAPAAPCPSSPRRPACRSPRSPRGSWPASALADFELWPTRQASHHVAVKEAVFPFARFPGVDIILGPEMKSTGEVMGLDSRFRPRLRQVPARRRRAACRSPARSSSRCKDKDKPADGRARRAGWSSWASS